MLLYLKSENQLKETKKMTRLEAQDDIMHQYEQSLPTAPVLLPSFLSSSLLPQPTPLLVLQSECAQITLFFYLIYLIRPYFNTK
jgi:hypothetical protein